MLGWLSKFQEQVFAHFAAFLRRHIFKSIGTTVAFTIALSLALLNPWFGSTTVKATLIRFMANDQEDVAEIVKELKTHENFSHEFQAGIQRAGYYDLSNEEIVDEWSDMWRPEYEAASEEQIKTAKVAAVKEARDRAREWIAPFDPGGIRIRAGRPACAIHRPSGGTVYLSASNAAESSDLAGFRRGDRIRILRADRRGRPVIAVVAMKDIAEADAWLNSTQYEMLGGLDEILAVTIVKVGPSEELVPEGDDSGENYIGCN